MPSPFPGMDPYIETSRLWPDFSGDLAGEIRAQLNRLIQPRYFARLETYTVAEIVGFEEAPRRIEPDVGVWQREPPAEGSGIAVATIQAPTVQSAVPLEVPLRLRRVQIRRVGAEELVTVIEILSPANKRHGHRDRQKYLRKRQLLFDSEVHLIEIDLLRGGERLPLTTPVPPAPYYALLSRAERRPTVDVWPIQLASPLPTLPVPLRLPDPDVPLDLGAAVAAVYERGAYAAQIDYRQPPPAPPLSPEEMLRIDELLRDRRPASVAETSE